MNRFTWLLAGLVLSWTAARAEEHERIDGLVWPADTVAAKDIVTMSPVLDGRDLRDDPDVFRDAGSAEELARKGQIHEGMQLLYWAIQRRPETYGYGELAAMYAATNNPDTAIYWLQKCAWAEGVDPDAVEQNANFKQVVADSRWPMLREFLLAAGNAWRASRHHTEILVLPKDYRPGTPVPLLLLLHGQMGTPERMLPLEPRGFDAQSIADKHHIAMLSISGTNPAARYSFGWTNDLAQDYRRIMEALERVKERVTPDMRQLLVAGFSRGAQEGIEIVVRHPGEFLGVFAICPGVTAGCRLADVKPVPDLKGKRFFILRGGKEGEPGLAVANADKEFVETAGAKVILQSAPGLGHALPPNYGELLEMWVDVGFARSGK